MLNLLIDQDTRIMSKIPYTCMIILYIFLIIWYDLSCGDDVLHMGN